MNLISSDRWPGLCVDKLSERLLPQGKFGNMDGSDARFCGRSLFIC
jgi:hypothetical protein